MNLIDTDAPVTISIDTEGKIIGYRPFISRMPSYWNSEVTKKLLVKNNFFSLSYKKDQIIDTEIKNITDFGVFLNIENSTLIYETVLPYLRRLITKATDMFKVGAYVHQYTEVNGDLEIDDFVDAFRALGQVHEDYKLLGRV